MTAATPTRFWSVTLNSVFSIEALWRSVKEPLARGVRPARGRRLSCGRLRTPCHEAAEPSTATPTSKRMRSVLLKKVLAGDEAGRILCTQEWEVTEALPDQGPEQHPRRLALPLDSRQP